MELELTKKINPTTNLKIRIDEKDLKEAFLKLTPFMQISGKCGLCKSENVSIQARKTKDKEGDEFIYLEVYCKDCRARQNIGEYKSPKGCLFLKKWEKYEPKNSNKEAVDDEDL